MSKAVVKSVKNQLQDKNVVDMFNQMIGTDKPNEDIIKPKYIKIINKINVLVNIFKSFADDILIKVYKEEKWSEEFYKFIEELKLITFKEDNLSGEYMNLKSNNTIKVCMLTCKNLMIHKSSLETSDMQFVLRIPGFDYNPFDFSTLNIKRIWTDEVTDNKIKQYIITVLKLTLKFTLDIYKIITSPDVDVKEFSKIIIDSISQVKKAIPRCDKAFKKIEESVALLENNFSGYYKDFVLSKNPSTIIESFVLDVSKNGETDIQTTRQFRDIINYYKKASQGKIKDPKVKKIFDMLNSNINLVDNPEQ